jgi:hypothetical protein
MFRAKFAECLLRSLVRRERAEEIVGDLMETYGSSATVSFWFALLRVIVRLGWRPMTALFLAAPVGLFSGFALTDHTARQFAFGSSKDLPLLFRSSWFAGQSASLGALAVFAFVRYGFRDRSSWLCALYSGLCTLYVYALELPSLRIEFYMGCAVVALVSLSASGMRRSSVVVATSLASWMAASRISSDVSLVLFSLTDTRRHLIGHTWIAAVVTGVAPLVVAALTFGVLHQHLMESGSSQGSPALR